jgi:DNA ligase (NAD+)
MERLSAASREDLEAIHEVGGVIADSAVRFFKQPQTRQLIRELKKAGVNMTESPARTAAQGPLVGKKFVFTGELEKLSRREAREVVKRLGGEVMSSVSPKTDYVVVGLQPGSKHDRAVELGIKILTEQKFQEMIHAHSR